MFHPVCHRLASTHTLLKTCQLCYSTKEISFALQARKDTSKGLQLSMIDYQWLLLHQKRTVWFSPTVKSRWLASNIISLPTILKSVTSFDWSRICTIRDLQRWGCGKRGYENHTWISFLRISQKNWRHWFQKHSPYDCWQHSWISEENVYPEPETSQIDNNSN